MDKSLYVQSYHLYRDKLTHLLERRIYKVFRHIADIAYEQCKNTNTIDKHVAQFQNALSFVAQWMPAETEKELHIFVLESGLEDFQDCISCLYVLQTRMLVDVKPGMKRHSISIEIMESAPFLHSIYIACARIIWKQALLFGCTFPENVIKMYQQRIHDLLTSTIKQAIDELIPISTIQRALLETYEDVREETTTEFEPVVDTVTNQHPPPFLPSSMQVAPQPQPFQEDFFQHQITSPPPPLPTLPIPMEVTATPDAANTFSLSGISAPPMYTSPVLATMGWQR